MNRLHARFSQERVKIEERLPAAQQFIRARKLNEFIAGDLGDIGIIVLGGPVNGVLRTLSRLDLADLYLAVLGTVLITSASAAPPGAPTGLRGARRTADRPADPPRQPRLAPLVSAP